MANWITHLIWNTIPFGAFTRSPDYEGHGGSSSGGSSSGPIWYVNENSSRSGISYDYYHTLAEAVAGGTPVKTETTRPTGKQGRDYVLVSVI